MPIRVEIHTGEGLLTGSVPRSGHLRDVLEAGGVLDLEQVTWRPWVDAGTDRSAGDIRIAIDEVLVAAVDDDPPHPVHATWHAIRLEVGPLRIEGELPTLPGYDPGRALARPTGEFVLLRDVRIVTPETTAATSGGGTYLPAAHVNRYAVDRASADLMLGFYFPGAVLEDTPPVSA